MLSKTYLTALFILAASAVSVNLLASGLPGALDKGSPRFLPVGEAFQLTVDRAGDAVLVRWFALPGYYLYRHSLGFTGPGIIGDGASVPTGLEKHDEFFGDVEVYYGELVVKVPISVDSPEIQPEIEVRWQGCADAGLCYPPQKTRFKLEYRR